MDTDGDGMTDSYDGCSDMGSTTLDSDEGDPAGEGFDDEDHVGITDDAMMFGGAGAGNQWFQAADTDGTFRMYFDRNGRIRGLHVGGADTNTRRRTTTPPTGSVTTVLPQSWATPRTRGAT